jgi:hypothetical protein
MAKHRLDRRNDHGWGGPELTERASAGAARRHRRAADRDTAAQQTVDAASSEEVTRAAEKR